MPESPVLVLTEGGTDITIDKEALEGSSICMEELGFLREESTKLQGILDQREKKGVAEEVPKKGVKGSRQGKTGAKEGREPTDSAEITLPEVRNEQGVYTIVQLSTRCELSRYQGFLGSIYLH